jgi:hypothetical protein
MGNPYHDPQTGEFTDGPGGGTTGDKTTDAVLKYTGTLKAHMTNNTAFDEEATRLANDKSVRTQEMRQIAKQVLGYDIKKGRTDTLQQIKDFQAREARFHARAPHQTG